MRPRTRVALFVALAVLGWLALGLRRVADDHLGVLEAPWLGAGANWRLAPGAWTAAPPGLLRLVEYPLAPFELRLPQADELELRGPDGTRFGLRGTLTARAAPADWRELHRVARRAGLEGALAAAVEEGLTGWDPGRPGRAAGPGVAREVERRLTPQLARRGLDLERLSLDALDVLTVSPGERSPVPEATRVLVIGLDGADWEILDELIGQGRLPHLERLIREGARAKLRSISPLLSPVIWTSVATGVEPDRHGILDFLVADEAGGSRQPVTSAQRRVPALWEILSREGVKVGVVGWWASWPADPVRGYVVSDRIAYQLFGYRANPAEAAGKTWPPELYERLVRPRIVEPESIGWDRVRPYLDGERLEPGAFDSEERRLLDEFRTLLASGETYLAVASTLSRAERPRLELVYFEGTDTVGHLFMPYRPPALPGTEARRRASFGAMVDRYYETADGYVGQLLAERDGSWTVIVLSDHGFATDATRPRTTDSRIGHGLAADWHRRFGVLVLSGAGVRRGVRLEEAEIYDIAPTILALFGQPVPRSWPGRVLGRALDPAFLERHPVRYRLDEPRGREGRRTGLELEDPARADLIAKLETLGYVGSAAGEGATGGSPGARNNAGLALLAAGRFAEAEAAFRAAIDEAGATPMLEFNLALSRQLQGRIEEAEAGFRAALEHPTTFRMAAVQLALLAAERRQASEAERLARAVLEREPDAADALNALGLALEARGDRVGAREAWRRAAELDPDAAQARINLGNLARGAGDLAEAERRYREAIEADPYFMGTYNNLALIYQARGQMERAVDLYRRALVKSADHPVVLNNLASLHFATGQLEEAERLWRGLTASDPEYASPYSNLAGIEITRGRLAEAERLLDRALELAPDYGDARINLALVRAGRGELARAREELVRATADAQAAPLAWKKLGRLELEAGRPAEAVRALEQALARGADAPTLAALGEAYRRLGRRGDALAAWHRSLELDPAQPALRRAVEQLAGAAPS